MTSYEMSVVKMHGQLMDWCNHCDSKALKGIACRDN